MKKDVIFSPLLPFTPEEEADLTQKIEQLKGPALNQYIESAQSALRNRALAPSWRPRVEYGLQLAQAALLRAAGTPTVAPLAAV